MTCRPLTPADVREFYGEQAMSMQGYVALVDGRLAGILGLGRRPDHLMLFSDVRPELRPYLRRMVILRTIYAMIRIMLKRGLPVFAIANPNESQSPALLARLGFEWYEQTEAGEVYRWDH